MVKLVPWHLLDHAPTGHIDLDKSFIIPNSSFPAQAGKPIYIQFRGLDRFSNNHLPQEVPDSVELKLLESRTSIRQIKLLPGANESFRAETLLTRAGLNHLQVVHGVGYSSSLTELMVHPSVAVANRSELVLPGQVPIVGENYPFRIASHDQFGNRASPRTEQLSTSYGLDSSYELEIVGEGRLIVNCMLFKAGSATLEVKLDGEHIRGSPVSDEILPGSLSLDFHGLGLMKLRELSGSLGSIRALPQLWIDCRKSKPQNN